ncbi:MAG: Nif3-like dinuclear metal center hexameric protein [Gemmatimonadetes bacterium]|uniref:GTP cyclohydrolase 1 type 2 homolog n=1 Tax=Candidatus Kutchimonas denitrificans TaxID=3056748 RepID=A0AAE4Z9M5_9BACT|nr:Nif3-like dinuclear metal center hexameric protein [Gemmatimonadota bacterium]NIR76193.1 Nif3-like dinuclear metal center hexameric protein [Candidatus Kutchimonas denitrificans]NIS00633.1 Nif3-like dinuclear metal center hexameric protein [Gemmatimonadota bacterium]NIT66778.1 Nif3-like dinuclear metal center hexameric protein [Gemmatimonadota bacterium]NIV23377.1 Nif3-like dinuclear metal center hexameric protein [Gemmatimonadota bacterium]
MAAVELDQLVAYLDGYLNIADYSDAPGAHNGLQVENNGRVSNVVACTDACQATIDAAVELGADLMIVHHGLFWGPGVTPLTGRAYRRIKPLIEHDIAVYSSHIPLDAHLEVGNNAELARGIGLQELKPFGEYEGREIGYRGATEADRQEVERRLAELLGVDPFVIPGGPERVSQVGVVTGGAGGLIGQARDAGLDTFITGEGAHYTYFDAEEWGINVFYAGHYATETLGVKALAAHVAERFALEWRFVDHPTGL